MPLVQEIGLSLVAIVMGVVLVLFGMQILPPPNGVVYDDLISLSQATLGIAMIFWGCYFACKSLQAATANKNKST